jgi:hypothetical protein
MNFNNIVGGIKDNLNKMGDSNATTGGNQNAGEVKPADGQAQGQQPPANENKPDYVDKGESIISVVWARPRY